LKWCRYQIGEHHERYQHSEETELLRVEKIIPSFHVSTLSLMNPNESLAEQ
jgi:hypothetical protein